MTQEQITGHFKALKEISNMIVGADLPEGERRLAQNAADSVIQIFELITTDINRIANSLERSS